MSNISSRIDKLAALLGGDVAPLEPQTDAELARAVAHILLLESHAENTDTDDHRIALDLVRLLAPDADDPETWLRETFGKRDLAGARWDEWKAAQKSLHPGSSLEQFEQIAAGKTSVPQIPSGAAPASPIGADGYYTREYEQARMERVTQRGGMQQTRPITSKWRRN